MKSRAPIAIAQAADRSAAAVRARRVMQLSAALFALSLLALGLAQLATRV